MKSLISISITVIGVASFLVATAAVAVNGQTHTPVKPTQTTQTQTTLGPSHTGQPNKACGSTTAPNTPGNAAAAPGSAFNSSGTAGTVYAGQQSQNSRNTASVSQYDVACFRQP